MRAFCLHSILYVISEFSSWISVIFFATKDLKFEKECFMIDLCVQNMELIKEMKGTFS